MCANVLTVVCVCLKEKKLGTLEVTLISCPPDGDLDYNYALLLFVIKLSTSVVQP